MRIQVRLTVSYAVIGVSIAAASFAAVKQIESTQTRVGQFQSDRLDTVEKLDVIANASFEEGFAYVLSGKSGEKELFHGRATEFARTLGRFAELQGPGGSQESTALVQQITSAHAELMTLAKKMFEVRERNRPFDAALFDKYEIAIDRCGDLIRALVELERQEVRKSQKEALAALAYFDRAMLGLGGFALAASLLVGWLFGNGITRPLRALKRAALAMGRGELDTQVQVDSHDELGELGESFRKMARSLKDARQHLVDQKAEQIEISRRAGMADVATSVLHNVGNVLNSVNVSAAVLMDAVSRSRSTGLANAADLLQAHSGDLPGFFARDERAPRLVEYLGQLAKAAVTEQGALKKELEGLQTNIDHIKTIVNMQQSHAKRGGMVEELDVEELVEGAVRLSLVENEHSPVQLLRDYAAPFKVSTDRHKVSQILLNLITNAKQALGEEPGRNQITVRSRSATGRLVIEVQDTGCGIPSENLTRVFNYGFTTKTDGHGFGLHASGCAAIELGGSLRCTSEGPGTGATFTLDLPLHPQASA
ncbi:MAG TPA: HAMP domain-containing sensor histidine kinase [Myxococcales bacterium]|nr:HAMP domain-containing sensor histidine kinase [Myxococcales bacterium]